MLEPAVPGPQDSWVQADFNGLFGEWLCLSHSDLVLDARQVQVPLRAGIVLTAYDHDADEQGRPDSIFATGTVEPSPEALRCRGSIWALRLDANGVRWESDLFGPDRANWPRRSLSTP